MSQRRLAPGHVLPDPAGRARCVGTPAGLPALIPGAPVPPRAPILLTAIHLSENHR